MRRAVTTVAVSVLALLLVALLVFGVLQTSDDSSLDQALARGEHPVAPDTSIPLLDGAGTRRLADFRTDGGYVVVNFFASWCVPCEEEAPVLNRLHRTLSGRGTVVGVAWNDLTGDTRRFIREHGVRYPVLRDVDEQLTEGYGVVALPETFVIDARGRVVALQRATITQRWVETTLDPLLASETERG